MHVGNYLGLVHASEQQLADAFLAIADHHGDEPDILQTCQLLAGWSQQNIEKMKPLIERYSEEKSDEPERLNQSLFKEPRSGSLALLRDLHDLWLITQEVQLAWIMLDQAAKALRDKQLESIGEECSQITKRQSQWLMTRMKQAAPQILVVAA